MNRALAKKILNRLPYSEPFRFADEITSVSETKISGTYTFDKNAEYYRGHFTHLAVTPGVLLIETMGQIGLVCFGIYLLKLYENEEPFYPVFSTLEADFIHPVWPGTTVKVESEKVYFRNNYLKCKIRMLNSADEIMTTMTSICTFKFDLK
jgi:3-hydroxyacyl-[acyl-carrier-protein] dehydratase